MGKMDSMKGVPAKGVVVPKGASKADMSGERMGRIVGGVAEGKEDAIGSDHQYNTGRTKGICYEHKREAYAKEDKSEK